MTAPVYKIHPAIGIARLGNSPDSFYLSPETTGAPPIDCTPDGLPIVKDGVEQPVSQYKDGQNRIRRQAARFRIYTYDDANPTGREIKLGDTLSGLVPGTKKGFTGQVFTGKLIDIQWTVYLANKKSSWYAFRQLDGEHGYPADHPLRNPFVTGAGQRQQLIIDPGPQTVSWHNKKARSASFSRGSNPSTPQSFPPTDLTPHSIDTLGEIKSVTGPDSANRLLVLGGFGNSGSSLTGFGQPLIQNYANSDGWFDDTSDGPVSATLILQVETIDGAAVGPQDIKKAVPVNSPAWVITGYPRYAPQITDIVTMDDLVYDVAVRTSNFAPAIFSKGMYNANYIPYFWRDIWPILERPFNYQFVADVDPVDGGDPHQSGAKSGGNFDPGPLSIPPYPTEDPIEQQNNARRRNFLYGILRKAGRENALYGDQNRPGHSVYAMPLLCGDNPLSNTVPSKFLRLTDTMLFLLKQWADGKFLNEQREDIKPAPLPEGVALDRGVLSNVLGGAFCPGGEASWIMRNPALYSAPYRINAAPSPIPGSLSQPSVVAGVDTPCALSNGLEPGDLTKYSAVPWQADFNECSTQPVDITYEGWNVIDGTSTGDTFTPKTWLTYWWPAHRPVKVNGASWSPTPNSHAGDLTMVDLWWQLGFVVPNTDGNPFHPAFVISENQVGG